MNLNNLHSTLVRFYDEQEVQLIQQEKYLHSTLVRFYVSIQSHWLNRHSYLHSTLVRFYENHTDIAS